MKYEVVLIGGSAGALTSFEEILNEIKINKKFPIVFLIHLAEKKLSNLPKLFSNKFDFIFREAEDLEKLLPGVIYIAPPMYHLQIDRDYTFSFSLDGKEHFSRPAIDVLFETAAETYKEKILGVILSGASIDGAKGAKRIEDLGGQIIVQTPSSSLAKTMPSAAIDILDNPLIMELADIGKFINNL